MESVAGELAITSEGADGSLIVELVGEKFFATRRPNFITRMLASLFIDPNRFPIANLPDGRVGIMGSGVLVSSLVTVASGIITVGKGEADEETMPADEVSNSLKALMSASSPNLVLARLNSATVSFTVGKGRTVAVGFLDGEFARGRTVGEGKVPSVLVREE